LKKRNIIKYILVNTLTLPLRVLEVPWILLIVIHRRAIKRADKIHSKIEFHEKATIKRKR